MTKEIAAILKRRIVNLSFIDTIAGIVQPVTDKKYTPESTVAISKKMPVSYDFVGGKSAILGAERQLVPNANKKSIFYFEDFGTTTDVSQRAGVISYVSNIRLVGWINKTKSGMEKYAEITSLAIDQILHNLVLGSAINEDGILRLFVTPGRIPIQDANIFSRYNYDEVESMYLRPPYEYFAIDLICKYQSRKVTCTGQQYAAGYIAAPIVALIKDVPNENAMQTLLNGDIVRKEYAPGLTLTILDKNGQPYLKGKTVLSNFVVDNGYFQQEPFNTNTGTFDHTEYGGFSSSNNPGIVTFDANLPIK